MRELLKILPRPSHYTGNEPGAIIKDPSRVELHIALAFPDVYTVGMSYLGQKILYDIANSRPEWYAERVMSPEREVCELLKARNLPLATLESDTPLNRLAAVCFSVTHELCFTDILNMLSLAGIPLRSKNRPESLAACPLVMAGGGAMLGAEPLSPFMDLVSLGDGEEQFPEILELLVKARKEQWGRTRFLKKAANIPGVYIPAFFEPDASGRLKSAGIESNPTRRIVSDLNKAPYPSNQITPVGAVHNRLSLEIARGCTRGCRFCHAGMVYRPVRERNPETVNTLLSDCLKNTGFDEVSFLALSAGDCTALKTLYTDAFGLCQSGQTTLALPSLRVGSVDDAIMAKMASLRRAGCTLAPEAGSQRLRDVINKGITEEDILAHCKKLLEHGWRQVKLYFMIGLPTEEDADLLAIAQLCEKIREVGGKGAPRLQLTIAISPFVPKPFTPFQWEAQQDLPEITRRINLLRSVFKNKKGMTLKWHDPETSYLEGILSRGDRKLAEVIEKAFYKGAVFCSWTESFSLAPWLEAMAECGLDPAAYLGERAYGQPLPWEHINAGVREEFLWRERQKALKGLITGDCRFSSCQNCGACDSSTTPSLLAGNGPITHKLVFSKRDQECHKPNIDDNGNLILKEYKNEPHQLPDHLKNKGALIRCWHYKTGTQAYLSHLELQTVLTRIFRQSDLPLAFSQGFHPLPLLSFGRALPVGVQSQAEWFTIWLHSYMGTHKVMEKLNTYLPADLKIYQAELAKKRAELALAESFRLQVSDGAAFMDAIKLFGDFAEQETVICQRKTKKSEKEENIRPYLLNWQVSMESPNHNAIIFTADWANGYISPLVLAQAILRPLDLNLEQIELMKINQTFLSGKTYTSVH